jgi:hypothetical protein
MPWKWLDCALIDEVGRHIEKQERQIGQKAKADGRAKWLATIPGIGVYSAMIPLSGSQILALAPTLLAHSVTRKNVRQTGFESTTISAR